MLTIFGGNLLRQWGITDRRTELCKWAQPSDFYDVVASQQGGCVDSRQWDAFHPMNIQNDTSSRFYNRLQGVYYAVVESRCDSTRRGVCVCVGRWTVGEWTSCSRTCGRAGHRSRTVRCVEQLAAGHQRVVEPTRCRGRTPRTRRRCRLHRCPAHWLAEQWGEVSDPHLTRTSVLIKQLRLVTVTELVLRTIGL